MEWQSVMAKVTNRPRVASLVFASVHEDAEVARAEVATQIAFYAEWQRWLMQSTPWVRS